MKIIFHIIGCLFFLSLPVIFSPDFDVSLHLFLLPPFQRNFIVYLLMLVFFYINYYFLVPRFYFTKKYFFYSGIVVIIFFIIILLPDLLFDFHNPHPEPKIFSELSDNMRHSPPSPPHFFKFFGFLNFGPPIVQFLLILILSLILKLNEHLRNTEKLKTIAELSYLKAQINPHFLFNTLNSIYALALDKSDVTATAIVKLSGIMRYIINEANSDFVPLEKEINYIRDYVDLQKFRFENTVNLSFTISGDSSNLFIAPLILIPFVENTFKHGINPEENSTVEINIDIKRNQLFLRTFNRKLSIKSPEDSYKLGLKNTQKRLENLYPIKYQLHITEDDSTYVTQLKIEL
ncbi:MAG: sensor histidine kinase [Bacteroidales bacterium]|nr:sensor histidine kinase [Bacteroidales bacterium]